MIISLVQLAHSPLTQNIWAGDYRNEDVILVYA